MRSLAILAVVCCLVAAPLRCQQSQIAPWFATVRLTISGQDGDTSNVVAWYSEELRRMQGVRIVDSAESWRISLILLKNENQGGVATGWTLSELILARYDPTWFFQYMAQADTSRVAKRAFLAAAAYVEPSWNIVHSSLHITQMNGLRSVVEDLAAKFDAEQLEPSRKAWDKIQTSKPN